jgi:enoyl-CoA hydratase
MMPSIQDLRELLSQDPPSICIEDFVGVQLLGPVGIITLARPEQLNVINLAGWRRILRTAKEFTANNELRVVLLRGSGDKAFGTGADIKEFDSVRMTPHDAVEYNETLGLALRAVAEIPIPVVAVIGGLAVGGGLELSGTADIRIASSDSRFGLPIGKLGVTLGYSEAVGITRLIGPANQKYLLFSSRLVGANDALRMGLIQAVYEHETLNDEAASLVQAIVSTSLGTLRAGKLVIDMTQRDITAADTEELARITVEAYSGDDLREGVSAFRERRLPRFPSSRPLDDDVSAG